MIPPNQSRRYTYRVTWSPEDGQFVGLCVELPSMSWLASTQEEAFSAIRHLAADAVDDMLVNGETPPIPISDRAFSGKFMVRVTPEMHRALAITAAEQGVSINQLVNSRLTNHPTL